MVIQRASTSDLCYILGSSKEAKERQLALLHLSLDEVSYDDVATMVMVLPFKQISGEDYHDLCLLLNITNLIATCCKGEFFKCEKIAQSIFPKTDVVR